MADQNSRQPASADAEGLASVPVVARLLVADGVRLDDGAPFAEVLAPPGGPKRRRESEELFYLFIPASGASVDLYREVRELVRETYWSASGGVTGALRRSASVVNRFLFDHNLNADRSERCYGGLACAVRRERDLFLLQAGPVWSCLLGQGQLRCFPRGEKLAHLGISAMADVRVHHVFATSDETLLLAPYAVVRRAGEEGLRRALGARDIDGVAASVEELGGRDFAALAVRWESAPRRKARIRGRSQTDRSKREVTPEAPPPGRSKAPPRPRRVVQALDETGPEAELRPQERGPTRELSPLLRRARAGTAGVLKRGLRVAGSALGHLWHGLAAVGAGLVALGKWLAGTIFVTVRSMLPGSEQAARRRVRRQPPPPENRTIMVALAVAIPIAVAVVVFVAYRGFAAQSRLEGVLNQARAQIALAQAAAPDSEEARAHWERALTQVEAAATLQPEDDSIQALRDQARQALDRFDRIERLELLRLADFGSGHVGRRLVLDEQALFVVDPEEGWAAEVRLDEVRRQDTGSGGEADPESDRPPVLLHTGQEVEAAEIGPLVDGAWVEAEGGRQSSALLVLEGSGRVISYDPAWRSASGDPQLSLVPLASPPSERSVAVGSYEGRFYVLDAGAGAGGEIWRYTPQDNGYPSQPERYFAAPPPEGLGGALDMAIDGYIYVLYQGGRVNRFLGGETQPFEIRGVPGGLGEVAGFAVDPEGDGTVYLADRTNERIVVLNPDGEFRAQLRAEPPLASLEALAVSQADRRVYVLAAGQVYEAVLP